MLARGPCTRLVLSTMVANSCKVNRDWPCSSTNKRNQTTATWRLLGISGSHWVETWGVCTRKRAPSTSTRSCPARAPWPHASGGGLGIPVWSWAASVVPCAMARILLGGEGVCAHLMLPPGMALRAFFLAPALDPPDAPLHGLGSPRAWMLSSEEVMAAEAMLAKNCSL